MDFTEIFSNAWTWIAIFFTSGGASAFFGVLSNYLYKRAINKTIAKALEAYNSENEANKTVELFIEKLKAVTLSTSIQPALKSELVKLEETVSDNYKNEVARLTKSNLDVILCFQAFAKYFANAYGVPDEVKAELDARIAEALGNAQASEPVKIEVVVEQPEEKPTESQNSADTGAIR